MKQRTVVGAIITTLVVAVLWLGLYLGTKRLVQNNQKRLLITEYEAILQRILDYSDFIFTDIAEDVLVISNSMVVDEVLQYPNEGKAIIADFTQTLLSVKENLHSLSIADFREGIVFEIGERYPNGSISILTDSDSMNQRFGWAKNLQSEQIRLFSQDFGPFGYRRNQRYILQHNILRNGTTVGVSELEMDINLYQDYVDFLADDSTFLSTDYAGRIGHHSQSSYSMFPSIENSMDLSVVDQELWERIIRGERLLEIGNHDILVHRDWSYPQEIVGIPVVSVGEGRRFFIILTQKELQSGLQEEFRYFSIVGILGFLFTSVLANVLLATASLRRDYMRTMEKAAITDPLTGLFNRRGFLDRLSAARSMAGRSDRPLSILLLDIDHFKSINDRFGHDIGDMVLEEVSKLMQHHIREEDLLCRWGGEEFLILLLGTGRDNAVEYAETLRERIERHRFIQEGEELYVTISIGVAEWGTNEQFEESVQRADQYLYEAKKSGRNCVMSEKERSPRSP